jgi:(1->4)-alpha-D-glucan 1-alpha-D-glucosylmutase
LGLQTAVTAWPIDADRLTEYLVKAAREASDRTAWIDPAAEYERLLGVLATRIVDEVAGASDLGDRRTDSLWRYVDLTTRPGWSNSLAALAIRLTSPGVPDLYQGSAAYLYSLVDPDNRTVPAWDRHRQLLEMAAGFDGPAAWSAARGDGDVDVRPDVAKFVVIERVLRLRRRHTSSFGPGSTYAEVASGGDRSDHVVAFSRGTVDGPLIVTMVLRRPIGLGPQPQRWDDTTIELPAGQWRNVLVDSAAPLDGGDHNVATLLSAFPVAVLERVGPFDHT